MPENDAAAETPAGSEPAKEKRPVEEQDGEKEKTENKENGDSKVDIPKKSEGPGAKEEVEFVHPEGGWGWMVMLASMWCNGSVFGIQNAFGVMYIYLLQEFGSPDDKDLQFRTCEYRLTWLYE